MSRLLALLTALCCVLLPGQAQAATQRQYHNPSTIKDIGDPFILSAEGVFWCFATTGGLGFQVRQSEDLINWSKPSYAYVPGIDSWADKDYWAPEVYAHGGSYYLFYSARHRQSGSLRVGLARADKPQGPYKDIRPEPLFDFGYAAIDASLFIDDDGQAYLYYARDCSENIVEGRHESHLYGIRLSEDLSQVQGEPVLLTRPDQPWELKSGPDWLWNEGPSLIKREGGYYLYYSANFYASRDYCVGVAVADSPLGPYVKQPEPLMRPVVSGDKVLVSGPGHNSFFTLGEELFTAYHSHVYTSNPSGYRQMAFDRAGFRADGSAYINGPTLAPQPLPLALLGLHNHLLNAEAQDEASARLMDGEHQGQGAQAQAYHWRWDKPVLIDSLVLYYQSGQSHQGYAILGAERIDISLPDEPALPGQNLTIRFEPKSTDSLSLHWEGEAPECFELMAIGEK